MNKTTSYLAGQTIFAGMDVHEDSSNLGILVIGFFNHFCKLADTIYNLTG